MSRGGIYERNDHCFCPLSAGIAGNYLLHGEHVSNRLRFRSGRKKEIGGFAGFVGLANGEVVRVRVGRGGERETVFEAVVVRVSDQFRLELHLDTDEANAAGVANGDEAFLV